MRIVTPDKAALLTALLLDRRLCVSCIRAKSGLTEAAEIGDALKRIERVLLLRRYEPERCHACGDEREVYSLERD